MILDKFSKSRIKEEESYKDFYRETSGEENKNYRELINSFMGRVGKKLIDIREEILHGERKETLDTFEGRGLERDLETCGLDESIERYFQSWYFHDSFAYETAREMDQIILDHKRRVDVMSQFISNDQLVRVYVSKNLPRILAKLGSEIKQTTKEDFIPALDSFEFHLIEEAERANDFGIENFATKFTYGDMAAANAEVKRLFNPSARKVYERIREKKQKDKEKCEMQIKTLLEQGVSEKTLHRFIRLSHWAGFEEPRKRYSIEGGIIDYLFRELVFQSIKKEIEELREVDFCLQLKQEDFLNHLRSLSNA